MSNSLPKIGERYASDTLGDRQGCIMKWLEYPTESKLETYDTAQLTHR
ncbi:hypothetical protein [Microcoleus sp. B4-D4]